ncbi:MAG TPA: zinc metalloprotease [Flavobacteriales bacterium]|jgi:hypothetical protein|nr:zinc metalloprotease [Flavobacteriales bacterium]
MRSLLIILSFLASHLYGQEPCATMMRSNDLESRSESYHAGMEEMRNMASQFEAGVLNANLRGTDEMVIPVVVHVVYREDVNNISMEQINSQIEALNRDFSWSQSDKDKIPSVWRDLGKNSGLIFKLADKDPDGNFTNGVTRTKTNVENIGDTNAYYRTSRGGIDPWVQSHYINIWVCEIGNNTLGYTYLPSTSAEPNDGIVMAPRAFGMIGTATPPYDKGRTLVHEMGHYFGLRHLWGTEEGECTNTDYMNDTPWQNEANFGCPNFPTVSCPSEDDGDMFMNFMDYTRDTCALFFTTNQVEFMQLVLLTSKVTLTHSEAVTGLAEQGRAEFNVFPNPASNIVTINFTGVESNAYSLINALGQIESIGKLNQGLNQIDVHELKAGVYLLKTDNWHEHIVVQ